ncbi:MAG: dihydroneopterin aldolase [Abditibacteriota bacterium]|nr:dihydroneopterin aldolase [Abditibacteriota bacterium]
MDKIHLTGITADCIIGVFPEERARPRTVVASLSLCADLSRAAASDDIRDTIDYFGLCVRIRQYMGASSFMLLESLAEGIARIALDEGACGVRIWVSKPGAMEGADARIEITRGNYE